MKNDNNDRAPLASPGEIVLVLLTISFVLLLLAPSLVSQ
jgi:competence protein ComGC